MLFYVFLAFSNITNGLFLYIPLALQKVAIPLRYAILGFGGVKIVLYGSFVAFLSPLKIKI